MKPAPVPRVSSGQGGRCPGSAARAARVSSGACWPLAVRRGCEAAPLPGGGVWRPAASRWFARRGGRCQSNAFIRRGAGGWGERLRLLPSPRPPQSLGPLGGKALGGRLINELLPVTFWRGTKVRRDAEPAGRQCGAVRCPAPGHPPLRTRAGGRPQPSAQPCSRQQSFFSTTASSLHGQAEEG